MRFGFTHPRAELLRADTHSGRRLEFLSQLLCVLRARALIRVGNAQMMCAVAVRINQEQSYRDWSPTSLVDRTTIRTLTQSNYERLTPILPFSDADLRSW